MFAASRCDEGRIVLEHIEMAHVEAGGFRLAYRRAGTGPPLVLLHGGLEDSRSWRPQLQGLSDEFTVIAWDAPGCGGSSDPPEHFRLTDYADCLAAFIRALGLDRPHVLGLSFGGGLALQVYGRHPTIPRSLVLASAYAGWAGSLPPEEVQRRLHGFLSQADDQPGRMVREFLPTLFRTGTPAAVIEETAAIAADFRPGPAKTMAQAFAEADLRDVLPLVDVPTLLLYGDADQRSPLPVARALHAAIPSSTLVVIPGAGHACNLETPDTFNGEVRRFLHALQASG